MSGSRGNRARSYDNVAKATTKRHAALYLTKFGSNLQSRCILFNVANCFRVCLWYCLFGCCSRKVERGVGIWFKCARNGNGKVLQILAWSIIIIFYTIRQKYIIIHKNDHICKIIIFSSNIKRIYYFASYILTVLIYHSRTSRWELRSFWLRPTNHIFNLMIFLIKQNL